MCGLGWNISSAQDRAMSLFHNTAKRCHSGGALSRQNLNAAIKQLLNDNVRFPPPIRSRACFRGNDAFFDIPGQAECSAP